MPRAFARVLIGLAAFAGAAAIGFFVTQRIASDSLRLEAEERLSQLVGSPVTIDEVRLAFGFGFPFGFGFRLEGSHVSVWRDGKRAPGLEVDRILATLRTTSLILGRPKFGRIVLDGTGQEVMADDHVKEAFLGI